MPENHAIQRISCCLTHANFQKSLLNNILKCHIQEDGLYETTQGDKNMLLALVLGIFEIDNQLKLIIFSYDGSSSDVFYVCG